MKKAFVLTLSLFIAGASSRANESHDLARQISETKRKLEEGEAEKQKTLSLLYELNSRMKKINREKSVLTDESLHAQDNIKNLAKSVAELEDLLRKQRVRLRQRLAFLYKMSGEGYLAALFIAQTPSELDQNIKYMAILSDRDYRIIRNYKQTLAEHKAQKTRLNVQIGKLLQLEKKVKRQEDMLLSERQAKTKMVEELEKSKFLHLSKMQVIRSRSAESTKTIDEKLTEMLQPSFYEKKGHLPAPVAGTLAKGFGLSRHELYNIRLSHKGWHLKAPKGSSVFAVFDGRVIYSGFLNGYGKTLILDQGDHFYTVYSHLDRVMVKNGDGVKPLQVIASAGNSSQQFGEGIYFEIRYFSEPEDPAKWIESRAIKISYNMSTQNKEGTAP